MRLRRPALSSARFTRIDLVETGLPFFRMLQTMPAA